MNKQKYYTNEQFIVELEDITKELQLELKKIELNIEKLKEDTYRLSRTALAGLQDTEE